MSEPPQSSAPRHNEAERLIELARELLSRPDEEMVVNYLDHAIEALHMIGSGHWSPFHDSSRDPVKCPSKASAPDRGSPAPALARPDEQ